MVSGGGCSVAVLNVAIAILHTGGLLLAVAALVYQIIALDNVMLVVIDAMEDLNNRRKENGKWKII